MNNPNILIALAMRAHTQGDFNTARTLYKRVLELNPNDINACGWLGTIEAEAGDYEVAERLLKKAATLNNDKFLLNYANVLASRSKLGQAIQIYEKLSKKNRNLATLLNLAECYNRLGAPAKAVRVADRALTLEPLRADAYNIKGNALLRLDRLQEALVCFKRAIEIDPSYSDAWGNLGSAFNLLKLHSDAISSYQRAIQLKDRAHFWLGDLIFTRMKVCDWANLSVQVNQLKNQILAGERVCSPFVAITLFDSPDLQKITAEIYVDEKFKCSNSIGRKAKGDKIRIGYFSMDFREHPVSHLIAELIETHDRDVFEVFGFAFGVSSQDAMRDRLQRAFDQYIDVRHLSDIEIVSLSRELKIDIAIDLGGHTENARQQIFSERLAPIQINFLGYPGTWGGRCMDYFVGDRITITEENRAQFSEKIIFLPNSFQVNPSHRPQTSKAWMRKDFGLPENCFVFCCFNSTWKITPEVFNSWLRILKNTEQSVLWLSYANELSKHAIQRLFEINGVSPARIFFANRLPDMADHLARYQIADLFLDTFPYGAHTTASDALWSELPVLTRAGRSFASRVCASLLTCLGISELITHTPEEYESLAIECGNNKSRALELKSKLITNKSAAPLFKTSLYAKHFESALKEAHRRFCYGLSPEDIEIF